jgi:hypothetical protein
MFDRLGDRSKPGIPTTSRVVAFLGYGAAVMPPIADYSQAFTAHHLPLAHGKGLHHARAMSGDRYHHR